MKCDNSPVSSKPYYCLIRLLNPQKETKWVHVFSNKAFPEDMENSPLKYLPQDLRVLNTALEHVYDFDNKQFLQGEVLGFVVGKEMETLPRKNIFIFAKKCAENQADSSLIAKDYLASLIS